MRTVLFDVDGTLVDSSEPILKALNLALADNGLSPVSGEDLWRHVGPPLQPTLESLLSSRGEDTGLVPRLMADYRMAYAPLSVDLAATFLGVPEMLATLEGTVRLGVVTSEPAVYAGPILERLGFNRFLEIIEGPDLSLEVEPKATTLRRALGRMGVADMTSVVMVGDRRQDVEAGHACSTETVGVTWGFGSQEELEDEGADYVINAPEQLVAAIGLDADGLGLRSGVVRLERARVEWGAVAADLVAEVSDVLGSQAIRIEHIGSTAVPGMLARPVIDLVAGVGARPDPVALRRVLGSVGWTYRGDAGSEGGLVFTLSRAKGTRLAHLHVVDHDGDQWCKYIALRDRLRSDPAAQLAYERTKAALVAEHASDNSQRAYTLGKADIIRELVGSDEKPLPRSDCGIDELPDEPREMGIEP